MLCFPKIRILVSRVGCLKGGFRIEVLGFDEKGWSSGIEGWGFVIKGIGYVAEGWGFVTKGWGFVNLVFEEQLKNKLGQNWEFRSCVFH